MTEKLGAYPPDLPRHVEGDLHDTGFVMSGDVDTVGARIGGQVSGWEAIVIVAGDRDRCGARSTARDQLRLRRTCWPAARSASRGPGTGLADPARVRASTDDRVAIARRGS